MEKELDEKAGKIARNSITGKTEDISNIKYDERYKRYVELSDKANIEENKFKNRENDYKLYASYREILGKDKVRSFKKFQNIKYNDGVKYKDLQLRYSIKTEYNLNIHDGRQGKHIKGHNNYNGSSYLVEGSDPQKLVYEYHGTGDLKITNPNKEWNKKEFVLGKDIIGFFVDEVTGKIIPTRYFSIHYSNKGTHIVPRKEQNNGKFR